MKKIIVRNKSNIIFHGAETEDPQSWIDYCLSHNYFGLPERIVDDVEGSYDPADVLEHIDLVVEEATEESPAVIKKQVKLKAEYTIEIQDITAQVEQEKTNREALEYLASTDWYVIREMDSGVPCPSDIKEARMAARASIVK